MAALPKFDLNDLKRRMHGAHATLKTELNGLRTGRASAGLLEPVHVEAYGQRVPITQVASISVPEPRALSVSVWDKAMVNAVDKAIRDANLGLSPTVEGTLLRIRIPELNEQRRKEMVKVAHKYAEDARVAVRHVRRDGFDVMKKLLKEHAITEDDGKRHEAEVQKATDEAIKEIDQLLAAQGKGDHAGLADVASRPESACRHRSDNLHSSRKAPRHVAIIMDGNGRWAQARGLPRYEGHRRGVEAVRRAVRAASEIGVSFLTLYSFSTENWSRPADEVSMLMGLLKRFIRNDLAELHANDVRVRVIGGRDGLAADIAALLTEAEELTRHNRGLTLVVAFNYGGRQEIVEAARRLAAKAAAGKLDPDAIGVEHFAQLAVDLRHSRSRPHHPHLGRAAAVELPALAGGLCRIRVPADALAGFRPRRVPVRARRVLHPRSALWRARARRRDAAAVKSAS